MKTLLAAIGGFIVVFSILGSLNIGNFALYYGPNKPPATWCQE